MENNLLTQGVRCGRELGCQLSDRAVAVRRCLFNNSKGRSV